MSAIYRRTGETDHYSIRIWYLSQIGFDVYLHVMDDMKILIFCVEKGGHEVKDVILYLNIINS